MALIYLSLGSNIDRHRRIDAALDALAEGAVREEAQREHGGGAGRELSVDLGKRP